ncbi:ABC transporter permease [Streptomyces sp. NPDC056470]|uniref:ABC transporter permease n=1 Tax=Streptomyces sp. NPDC056470 TaxID=3345831 RepID=UPI0036C7B6F7
MARVDVQPGDGDQTGSVRRDDHRAARAAQLLQRFGLIAAWAALVLTFSVLEPDTYATAQNFQTIFSSQAVLLVLAVAALPPLIAGELDLSIAGVMGLALVLVGFLNVEQGWPIGLAILAAVLTGAALGLINAVVVVTIGVDSIVATLGMGTLLAGIALGITYLPITGVSLVIVDAVTFKFAGLQAAFYIALAICLLVWFVLQHMPAGRRLYFVGAGRDVARLSGINVERFRMMAFVAASTLSAMAGVMFAGLLASADPTAGPALLLPALAAVFLGATAVTPGRFNVWGTFIAVYFLVSGITGLQILGVAGWIGQVFYGGALIVAVVLSRLAGMRFGRQGLGQRAPRDAARS